MGRYFTYITGVATLLAFIIQVRDIFPKHRETRKVILFLAAGIFLGSIFGGINSFEIKLEAEIHPVKLLLLIFLPIISISIVALLVVAVSSPDHQKRGELYPLIGGTVVFFVWVLMMAADPEFPEQLTNRELLSLTSHHLESQNYETALKYLKRLQYRYDNNDPRRKEIVKQIENVKEKMAKSM